MKKSKIIIFGANEDGKQCLQLLKPLQWIGLLKVVAVMDNDSRLGGQLLEDIEIVSPEDVNRLEFDRIIVAPLFFDEISQQLRVLGVDEKKIIPFYSNYSDFFGSTNQSSSQRIKIGKYSYYKPSTQIWDCEIGNFCHIGSNCLIGLIGHDPTRVTTYPLEYHFSNTVTDCSQDPTANTKKKERVKILNDVYMGEGVVVMGGVTIGNGAVIGTRSVITKDIPDYSIVGGVPAKLIKKRFSDQVIEALLEIRWWDWPDEKIKENMTTFNLDIEKFISIHKPQQ
jgi:acetyltransferase-like isoleucine patch superfamily enzyme